MIRKPVDEISPGDTLAGTLKISSPHPNVLYKLRLESGTEITKKHLQKVNELNISKLPIKEEHTEDLDKFADDEEVEEAEDRIREEFSDFSEEVDSGTVDRKDLSNLRSTINDLIDALQNSQLMAAFTTLKTHDNYTAEHSLDVLKISLQLTMKYEQEFREKLKNSSGASSSYINKYMLKDLGLGAMLHDLGKHEVPKKILTKPDKLTDEEWDKMAEHPRKGFEQLQELKYELNAPVRLPALQHHEKYDGSGYPRQIEGDDIHLFGRITAPADVYSALTSNRPYRDAMTPTKALDIMEEMQQDGPHFDPDIYQKFLTLVLPYPLGEKVELSDGREGVVCEVDETSPRQPTVRILFNNGEKVDQPEEIQVPNRPGDLRIIEPEGKTGVARSF